MVQCVVLGWLLQLHSGWPFYSDSVNGIGLSGV